MRQIVYSQCTSTLTGTVITVPGPPVAAGATLLSCPAAFLLLIGIFRQWCSIERACGSDSKSACAWYVLRSCYEPMTIGGRVSRCLGMHFIRESLKSLSEALPQSCSPSCQGCTRLTRTRQTPSTCLIYPWCLMQWRVCSASDHGLRKLHVKPVGDVSGILFCASAGIGYELPNGLLRVYSKQRKGGHPVRPRTLFKLHQMCF